MESIIKLLFKLTCAFSLLLAVIPSRAAPDQGTIAIRLQNHVPARAIAKAKHLGRLPADQKISLVLALNLRNQEALGDFINEHLYNPRDPLFGHYLTTRQFTQAYGPAYDNIKFVSQYLTSLGLTVTGSFGSLIHVEGSSAQVEKAFNLEMHQYLTSENVVAYAPTSNPQISTAISTQVAGIVGLNNFPLRKPFFHLNKQTTGSTENTIGSGPQGGLTPTDIKTAYGLTGVTSTGTGQTLALFELDAYTLSDIQAYAREYNINTMPTLQNILVDTATGKPGSGAIEVTLDIELMIALAPGATKILVYEGPNSETGLLDTYSKIANDNLATEVSTSWGAIEADTTLAMLKSENTVFMQMAAQGQTIFAASGDEGADANGTSLSVQDPGSQPYVTGVGGTTLSVNTGETYKSESSWGVAASGEGGGGGISSVWPLPTWQAGLATTLNKGSTTARMVPDISLNANLATGYSLYYDGQFTVVGGTSCAAPLWAAFTALINEQRLAQSVPVLGFANPPIYQLASSSLYAKDFHDIADSSTNLFYPAVAGYDLSTGWGSFNGSVLMAALVNPVLPPYAPTLSAVPYNAAVNLTWTAPTGAASYTLYRGTSSAGPFTAVATALTKPSYGDGGLQNGTAYYYYVTATDSAGASGNSATLSATPVLVIPPAPTNFQVVALPAGGT